MASVLRYTLMEPGISLNGSEHIVKRLFHIVKRLAISLKGTVNTGFAAIFKKLKGSRHIVKRLSPLYAAAVLGYRLR